MATFVVKQAIGGKINGMKGGLDKLTGGGSGGEGAGETNNKVETAEDPEAVQARIEAEERRKEKHRKMEMEREKMRQDIRDKYGIRKKEDQDESAQQDCAGRIGAVKRKTPEELAKEAEEDDSLMGQMNGMLDKAKTAISGVADTVKGFLPFGK